MVSFNVYGLIRKNIAVWKRYPGLVTTGAIAVCIESSLFKAAIFFGVTMRIDQVTHNCIALIKEKLEEHISDNTFDSEVSKKLDFIQQWLDESKITIAIPEKITKEWYRDVYLVSAHWQKKRAEALGHANWCCQLCNEKKLLNVHHRTYKNLGCENIQDLIVLCGLCHDKFHDELEEFGHE